MWRHAPRPVRGVMVRAVIGLTATAMIAATGSHFVMPDVKRVASYDILNVAAIDDSPSTVGISEGSDWYYAVNDALSKPGITAAEIEAIRADVDQRLQSMLDIGVTNVRVLVPWANIEQKDPSLSQSTRNWNALDMIVNAANAKGMGILGVLNSTPVWATESTPINGQPTDVNDFADFAKQVALRYGDKISAYEVWNEPNAFIFWNPVDPVDYTTMLKATYTALKQAASQLNIDISVIGAVVGAGSTWGNLTMNPVDFVTAMYNAGANGYFDALSFHPYDYYAKFSDGNVALSQAQQLRELMDSYLAPGQEQLKLWISEYGLPTNLVSETAQKDFITDFINFWQTVAGAGPIFLYTTRDTAGAGEDLNNNEAHFGLFYEDGTPKPIALVLKELIQSLQPTTPTEPSNPVTSVLQLLGQLINNVLSFVPNLISALVTSVVTAITQIFKGFGGQTATATALSAARTATVEGVSAETVESAALAGDKVSTAGEEAKSGESEATTEAATTEAATTEVAATATEVTEPTTVTTEATAVEAEKVDTVEESTTTTPAAEPVGTAVEPVDTTKVDTTKVDATKEAEAPSTGTDTTTKPDTTTKDDTTESETTKPGTSKDDAKGDTKPDSTTDGKAGDTPKPAAASGSAGADKNGEGAKATREGSKAGHPERGTKPKGGVKDNDGVKSVKPARHGAAATSATASKSDDGGTKAGASASSGSGGSE